MLIVLGLPYFAALFAGNLRREAPKTRVVVLDPGSRLGDRILFPLLLPFARGVYQIGGALVPGGALALALFLKKKIIFHWVGTDVLNLTIARRDGGQIDRGMLEYAHHLADAPWLSAELAQAGIVARSIPLIAVDAEADSIARMPEDFSVLSYVGVGREKFYGIERLISLARRFPEIKFKISSLSIYEGDLPPNLLLLGFVESLKDEMAKSWLFLRLPSHDGLAFSVVEALSLARFVGYAQDFQNTWNVATDDGLESFVRHYYRLWSDGWREPNLAGRDFVLSKFSRPKVYGDIVEEIISVFGP